MYTNARCTTGQRAASPYRQHLPISLSRRQIPATSPATQKASQMVGMALESLRRQARFSSTLCALVSTYEPRWGRVLGDAPSTVSLPPLFQPTDDAARLLLPHRHLGSTALTGTSCCSCSSSPRLGVAFSRYLPAFARFLLSESSFTRLQRPHSAHEDEY